MINTIWKNPVLLLLVIVIRNQLSQIQAWRICVKTGAWKSLYWKTVKNIRKKRQANYKREEGCCAASSSLFFIFCEFTKTYFFVLYILKQPLIIFRFFH